MVIQGPCTCGAKRDIGTCNSYSIFLFYKMMQDKYIEMKDANLIHELVDVTKGMPTLDDIKT